MNIIQEQRNDIIETNNTAQQRLIDILETLSPRATTLIVREPLYGDIDFEPIKEGGFKLLKTIVLPEGKITSIINIPNTVEIFECAKNMLFSVENLPSSIQVLNLSFNFLSNIHVSDLTNLRILNVSHNQITKLENIPEEIQEIHCEFNRIESLDLKNLNLLKTLNISNNLITVIENMPNGIVEFKMENTPSIEFRNSAGEIPVAGRADVDAAAIQTRDYTEALNKYFKLKQSYQTKVYKNKKQIYENEPNKRIARTKIAALKPKCIKCKRAVGTIFTKTKNRYLAMCGDTTTPCALNIEIFNGNFKNIYYFFNLFSEDVANIKDTIITQKLDTIFNYISEEKSVELFKKEIHLYNQDSNIKHEYFEKYERIFNNEENQKTTAEKWQSIYALIEDGRKLLTEYKETGNRELLKLVVQTQVNDILPEIRNLRLLNNKIMEIDEREIKPDVFEHWLLKYPVLLSQIEETTGEQPRVIKFAI
jgi:Leucine-rich repeat (LRR) protein